MIHFCMTISTTNRRQQLHHLAHKHHPMVYHHHNSRHQQLTVKSHDKRMHRAAGSALAAARSGLSFLRQTTARGMHKLASKFGIEGRELAANLKGEWQQHISLMHSMIWTMKQRSMWATSIDMRMWLLY